MADHDGTDLEQVTDMMLDALRLLAAHNVAVIRRHADLTAGEIPVRTASALERRGWAARRHTDGKVTVLDITAAGALAAAGYGYDVAAGAGGAGSLTEAQAAHVERAIRYLGEAMTALGWAKLPMPQSAEPRDPRASALWDLVRGERLVGEASDALIAGIAQYHGGVVS